MGLNKQDIEELYWSGLLHDVGKIGITEKILLKSDKLTDEEFEEVKRHTIIGYGLITSVSQNLHLVAEGVRSHHEKWNGEGYPDGLKGQDIPLFGRILAIVDVFEALTSERPYKDSWDPEEAFDFISKQKGIYFDTDLVEIFQNLFYKKEVWISNKPINLNEQILPAHFNKELIKDMG